MNGRISDRSPIGAALLAKTVGDEVTVSTPGGELKFRIERVERTKNVN